MRGPLLDAVGSGWIGVDLFFVISGFVIARSALASLAVQDSAVVSPATTGRAGSRRIVPLYLLTCAAWIVLFRPDFFEPPADSASLWQRGVAPRVRPHVLARSPTAPIDGANWTLALEMQFYVAVALLIPWIARTPGWRIWLGCIAIAVAWRAAMYLTLGPAIQSRLFFGVMQLPGVLDEFGAGIFLARIVDRGAGQRPLAGVIWVAAAAVAGTVCMSVYWAHSSYWDVPGMVIVWRTLRAFFLCVVAAAVRLPSFAEILAATADPLSGRRELRHLPVASLCRQVHPVGPRACVSPGVGCRAWIDARACHAVVAYLRAADSRLGPSIRWPKRSPDAPRRRQGLGTNPLAVRQQPLDIPVRQ